LNTVDPQRLKRIDDLFQAALDMSPASRGAFLDDACANDAALRQEVESLLLAHDRASGFIQDLASDIAADWAADHDLLGQSIGKYEVRSSLGAGGMGQIYLAEDTQLRRKVALKFLSSHIAGSEEGMRRLRREAEAASALNHPNILTVYEVGRWRGRDYLVTEYVEGVTLRTWMRNTLSLAGCIDIALQIASALEAAHSRGIIHRDIKPENVMVRPDGLVKVLDFGIAKYAAPGGGSDASASTTAAGVVVGTTAYMSPEQARGSPVDLRTDVWSLGVVLFEMVAGCLPFPGETPSDRMAAILERDPESLAARRPDVPKELERIISRALVKDPQQRHTSAAAMAEDLRTLRMTFSGETPFRFVFHGSSIQRRLHHRRTAITVAVFLLAVAGAVGVWFHERPSGFEAATIQSLAVLPLVNAGGSPDTDYLSDGLTDALIDSLSTLPELKVRSHNSVFRYKGQRVDIRTVGSALRVQALVTGRVVRRGDSFSVEIELVDARDDTLLWGAQYDRTLTKLVALQSEVTRDISRKLRMRLSGTEERRLARNSTEKPEAYERYLKGRYHVLKATREEVQTGIAYLRQAIEIDPSYALAYVGLADAYRVLALAGESPATEELPKAKAAAAKAVEIDEELADAHAILGFVIFWSDWKWSEAEHQVKRALDLDPNSADAHEAYANVLSYTARHADALAEIRRAAELDPLNVRIGALQGAFLVNAGRPDEALATLGKTLELEPNYWFARQYRASAYIDKGMFAEAIDESRRAQQFSGASTRPIAFLGYALARSGKRAEARAELEKLLRLSEHRYVSPYNVAMIYAGLDRRDEALAWLERGYREREPRMVFLKSEPKWNSLRGDPRFRDLLERIGFMP
jgi:serine/threonine protein kinase/tetratricopeptide (TPR) repeat protein